MGILKIYWEPSFYVAIQVLLVSIMVYILNTHLHLKIHTPLNLLNSIDQEPGLLYEMRLKGWLISFPRTVCETERNGFGFECYLSLLICLSVLLTAASPAYLSRQCCLHQPGDGRCFFYTPFSITLYYLSLSAFACKLLLRTTFYELFKSYFSID